MNFPIVVNLYTLFFGLLALIALVAAYEVVTNRLITHAAFFLALVFVAIAGIFLLLGAEFLAVTQVLVYAGAVTVMIIFAIMMSQLNEIKIEECGRPPLTRRLWLKLVSSQWGLLPLLFAVVFALAMFGLYARAAWPMRALLVDSTGPATTNIELIGAELFTTYAIPFEVASVILLVALVGAIVLTAKEERS
ncbi:MAG: NADH-quinone oxidoreductase subunit J family protein [Bacillota bacterium]